MVAFAIPWAAMGIGALMGGLTSKQRGGNFLKGALQGAALGGITGGIGGLASGTAAGTSAGGVFGFGSKMIPNFLAMSGIGMGAEMLGQQDANKRRMEQTRKWLDEEEERRIARLSKIAGYDVADSANFMTPNKYFAAEGGMISRPGYPNGGSATLDYTDPDLYTPTGEGGGPSSRPIQQIPLGPGPSFVDEFEDFDYMDAGSEGDESGWYEMFFNEFGRPPIDINELQLFIDQSDISPTDVAQGGQQGPMMAAEGGQVNRPGYKWGGSSITDQGFDTSGGETWQQAKATQMGDKGLWTDKWFGDERTPMAQDYNQLLKDRKSYGQAYIDKTGTIDTEEKFFNQYPNIPRTFKPFEDLEEQMNIGEFPKKAPEGYFEKWGAAHGGSVMGKDEYDEELNRPNMFLGGALGLGALLGLGKLLGGRRKRGDVKAKIKDAPVFKMPGRKPGLPIEDEELQVVGLPWVRAHQPKLLGAAKGGGIGDLDLRGGGASVGPGSGTSDDIPAMLSDGEFVVTANAVQNLGGGDRMLGAQRMYRMMNQLDPASQTPAEMSGVGYA